MSRNVGLSGIALLICALGCFHNGVRAPSVGPTRPGLVVPASVATVSQTLQDDLTDAGIAVLAKREGRNERLVGTTKAGKKPTTKTENVVVTISDSTRITQTVSVAFSDLNTGSCVTATGTADSVGTVTATNVTMSQPVNGSCRGFGGFGGFGSRGGQNGGGQNGGSSSSTTA